MPTSQKDQRVRITKTYVDSLRAPEKDQSFVRDAELRGFGVRITRGGVISFIVEKRIHGRSTRKTLGQYPAMTVEAARRQAQIFLGQVADGRDPVAEARAHEMQGTTLHQAFEDFQRIRGKNLRPNTLTEYGRFMARVFPDWQARPLTHITKEMVARRHQKVGETSGPAYANHAFRFLRALFNFAIAQYEPPSGAPLLTENPVDRLKRTKAWFRQTRRHDFIKPHQLPAWYAAVEALRQNSGPPEAGPIDLNHASAVVADYLLLLVFTGLRRTEGLSLRWDQVDLLDRTLFLPDPKNHQPLTLPLSDVVQSILEGRHAQRIGDYVFPGTGRLGHLVEPKKQVDRVKEYSGVPFRLHDLRRTFATTAKTLNISEYAIKQLINHKMDHEITSSYMGNAVEDLREPMQQIADRLKSLMRPHEPSNVIPLSSRPRRQTGLPARSDVV